MIGIKARKVSEAIVNGKGVVESVDSSLLAIKILTTLKKPLSILEKI